MPLSSTVMDVSYSAFHSRADAEPFQRLVGHTGRRALTEMELDFGFYGATEAARTYSVYGVQ